MTIGERLRAVRERIRAMAATAGREPDGVRLLAVSKLMPSAAIREAYAAGQRDFGENYVQELLAKAEELRDLPDLRFHVIGHLQRNKARQVVREASVIHSVDSPELFRELAKRAAGIALSPPRRLVTDDPRIAVLVEVNIAEEPQKHGVRPSELGALLEAARATPELCLLGLMCVPPADRDAQPYFEQLRALRDAHGGVKLLPELSMGMSSDMEAAIASGATWLRIGTAIFGERAKKEA